MKTTYSSTFFTNSDGSAQLSKVPLVALATYAKRDACLVKMREMGGMYATPTPEFMKLRASMLQAKKKIEKNGWFSETV
jgi:hypothetical protein